MTRPLAVLAMTPLILLAGCGQPSASGGVAGSKDGTTVAVEVTDAWCRATPNGARAGACYAVFKATGQDDRLVGAATPAAGMAMVHDMTTQDGIMSMSHMADGLPLPEGQDVTLAPGGTHLMLTDLTGPLVEGGRVALTLDFAGAPDVTMQVPVRAATEG